MKKIIMILAFMAFAGVKAQMNNNQKTVSVSGKALVERVITNYKVKATLSMDQIYYADYKCKDLAELKAKYFDALKEQGVDVSKFKEKKMEFFSLGYQKEGTILIYETSDKEIVKTLLSTKMNGVQLSYQSRATLSQDKIEALLTDALTDAKANAAKVCKVAGKSVGEIVSIVQDIPSEHIWNNYYNDYEEFLTVSVAYELK
ncbi:SIMPL domain-containing protein [Maribacter sp. 2210JD10-5]|uniref:SIMPL domain-containing protein n=1 Tax=Maribacter sp. 2210JD10-5 TaxID=3386272 RepID=UPI0039BD267C